MKADAMNAFLLPVIGSLLLFAVSCSKSGRTTMSAGVPSGLNLLAAFSAEEVKTKSWKQVGKELVLVNYSTMEFSNRANLVVAQYGASDATVTNCVDFFVELPTPEGEPKLLVLLAHDCGVEILESITV